jgi:hypothetical protein
MQQMEDQVHSKTVNVVRPHGPTPGQLAAAKLVGRGVGLTILDTVKRVKRDERDAEIAKAAAEIEKRVINLVLHKFLTAESPSEFVHVDATAPELERIARFLRKVALAKRENTRNV